MRRSRALVTAAMFALSAVFLTACGDGRKAQTGAASGEMVFYRGNAAEPETLDPSRAIALYEDHVMGELLVGLMTFDDMARPIPGAATSWETSADGLTWTFHLRDENWSDGQPVTAEDFVFGWQRLVDPKTASKYAYFLYLVKNAREVSAGKMPVSALGVRAVDTKTFEVTLVHPAPYMLELLTHHTTYPLPKHVVEKLGDAWVKPGNYVGNGPYTLTEWVPNDHITITKNPRFFDAANVKVDKVVYYPTADYDAALRRFRAGELDIQSRLPANQISWIKANIPKTLNMVPELTMDFIAVNFKRKPFDDVRVRQALSLAYDRETIVNKIRKLNEPPAYNYVPPGIVNFPHTNAYDWKSLPYGERVKKAQGLMQAAGFGPNKRLKTTFMIRANTDIEKQISAATQQMWRAIYVDIDIVVQDTAIFYNKCEQHDFDIAKPAWGSDFNDASNFLDLMRTGIGNNYMQYSNPKFDALMDKAQAEKDLTERGKLLAEAEAVAMNDYAWLPAFFWVNTAIVQPYVHGWKNNARESNRNRWVTIDTKARAEMFSR